MFNVADWKQKQIVYLITTISPKAKERALEFISNVIQGSQKRKQVQESERLRQGHSITFRERGRYQKDSRQTPMK
jgi:hypothetical protein